MVNIAFKRTSDSKNQKDWYSYRLIVALLLSAYFCTLNSEVKFRQWSR